MTVAFAERTPTDEEFQRFRLILSTYQDGTGMLADKNGRTLPGWRDERTVALFNAAYAVQNKDIFAELASQNCRHCPGTIATPCPGQSGKVESPGIPVPSASQFDLELPAPNNLKWYFPTYTRNGLTQIGNLSGLTHTEAQRTQRYAERVNWEKGMSINFSDLSRNMVIELDGQPWQVMDYERHKMQQRAPVTRIKMKNLISGAVVERTFQRYDTDFTVAEIDNRETQYLYTDGNYYYFLDQETFDQYELTREQLGSTLDYLTENMMVEMVFYKGSSINMNLPTHVDLKVADTPPAFRGDTAQGGNKPATLETGLRVNVPMFITPGTVVRVDTRTGQYTERVS